MTIRGGMSWRYFVILNEMILTLMRERERERERERQLEARRVGSILLFLMRWF